MFNLFDIEMNSVTAFAHSSGSSAEKEKFVEHCDRTLKYFDKFIATFELEFILSKLANEIDNGFEAKKIFDYLRKIVYLHDIGKLTKRFQRKLDGEKINETHSDKGFHFLNYSFLLLHSKEDITAREFYFFQILLFSVFKHHGKLNDLKQSIKKMRFSSKDNKFDEISHFLNLEIDSSIIDFMERGEFYNAINNRNVKPIIDSFLKENHSLFIFLKLFHSLLISADYYATAEYTEQKEFEQFTLTKDLFENIWNNFHTKKEYRKFYNLNVDINDSKSKLLNLSLNEIEDLDDTKENKLNILRSKLNVESEQNLKKYLDSEGCSNVYLLNIPTGGGKTNISMRLALRIMKERKIKKLFYVFPFINIIEQSYESIELYSGSDNITRLDSRYVNPLEVDESYEFDKKVSYGKHIDNLFFNKPVLMLSHIKFFDMILRNDKNSNYNFYQLANSVVIIDEIQAYNDNVWTELASLMGNIGEFLNTHFIIMSATLPNLESLLNNANFNSLLNKNFRDCIFESSLFKRTKIIPTKEITQENIPEYIQQFIKDGIKKILIVLNKIDDSYNLYESIIQSNKCFSDYEISLLNSTIIEEKRKLVIEYAKEDRKIILIATQSVEAGVDIDFDIGIRAYSPLDSIIQVAGRINRNSKKEICNLFIFPDKSSNRVYRGDNKSKVMKEYEDDFFKNDFDDEHGAIKNFYDSTIQEIRKFYNNAFIQNPRTYLDAIQNLEFKKINDEIKLIDADTISLFIPFKEEAYKLWEQYISMFEEESGFTNFIRIKEFRKQLIPYNVNLFNYYTNNGRLKDILHYEIKYGFYFCKDWEEYFEINSGLNIQKFKEYVTSGRGEFL